MDDHERTILIHYNIPEPFPLQWPADKDDSDESEGDFDAKSPAHSRLQHRRSKPRHSALERLASSRRSRGDAFYSSEDTAEVLARKDEPDPLGFSDSVVRVLRQRGLPIDDDAKLRKT